MTSTPAPSLSSFQSLGISVTNGDIFKGLGDKFSFNSSHKIGNFLSFFERCYFLSKN